MTTFPSLTGKALIAALKRAGFDLVRVKGSHHYVRHPDGRTTVVPVHAGESIGRGLLAKILRDVEMDPTTLHNYL
ncbi:MAG: type II toxin-antitoxin system HicA family toxin [Chiayiivirga sp.]|uniref:type II toxin-antitoxin system HicA family toxin n=1 Tax=Chiayiivirga sp. TaxID=2041042 RepID=UPI0025C2CC36|nr:type II toxin-antitoxin system HicA family toxin [Chiayiivirga sp.]MCI1711797.1 type II toxin-antitoxin system HicA family toxin [Chiayiivirga sp.]MCI1729623.1 type II toxin-antitoxin system HicA family toxin [Chiayiivirga sp.]